MLEKIFEEIYFYLDQELAQKAARLLNNEDLLKISISHTDYLEVIKDKGRPALGEIAQELNFSKPSVTTMVNKLIKQGFVKKVRSEQDKRVFYVELTDLGRELIEIRLNIFLEFAERLEQVLAGEEAIRLAVLLKKGLKALSENE